jgi:hypothetical protein
MVDEEKFFAWLDGELPPHESAEVERQVAADPRLARLADEHRSVGAGLRDAFDSVAAAPVPERLRDAARPKIAKVIDIAACREALARPFLGPLPQWTAMAAMLALGLFAGALVGRDLVSSPVNVRGGEIYAAGAVEQALETRLASAPATGDVRIGLTFRDQSGSICRTFQSSAASGLACRYDGDWRLRGLFAAPEGAEAEYRMAAGADPRLMELADSVIAGEPFDAAQEAQAKQRGWR